VTNFAVIRVRKLKSESEINNTDAHNSRVSVVNHASQNPKLSQRLIGSNSPLFEKINHRINELSAKTRKDSVLSMEVLMSASPSYFRPNNPHAAGEFDHDKMKAWVRASVTYAKKKWGDNLLSADLHLDESTPHLHLIVTPISKKKRKKRSKQEFYEQYVLDANGMFGKKALSQMQTDYAEALNNLGIQRGLKGSPAQHQHVREFYKLVNESKKIETHYELPSPPLTNRTGWKKQQESEINRIISEKNAQIEYQKRNLNSLAKSTKLLAKFGGFKSVGRWFKRLSSLVKELATQRHENENLRREIDTLDTNFDKDVLQEVNSQIEQYKNAYAKKCKEVEVLRYHSERYPVPKGPSGP